MKRDISTLLLVLGTLAAANAAALGQDKDKQPDPPKNLITKETRQAIDAGLVYLAAQQAADGSWGDNQYRGDLGVTGLAGLAFLAGGHHPGMGPHRAAVTKAVEF